MGLTQEKVGLEAVAVDRKISTQMELGLSEFQFFRADNFMSILYSHHVYRVFNTAIKMAR